MGGIADILNKIHTPNKEIGDCETKESPFGTEPAVPAPIKIACKMLIAVLGGGEVKSWRKESLIV